MTDSAQAPREQEIDHAGQARGWLMRARVASLGTLSADAESQGYPFQSVVPFALSPEGAPFILIASIAQHTRNLIADERCSLMVRDPEPAGDPQASWRLTVLGRAVPLLRAEDPAIPGRATDEDRISAERFDDLLARYCERVPQAASYFAMHGFHFWRIQAERIRMIAGFGQIEWLAAEAIKRDPAGLGWGEDARPVIEHMNADHADALKLIVAHHRGIEAEGASLLGVDPAGFTIATEEPAGRHHFSFEGETPSSEARKVFVAWTREARAAIEGS